MRLFGRRRGLRRTPKAASVHSGSGEDIFQEYVSEKGSGQDDSRRPIVDEPRRVVEPTSVEEYQATHAMEYYSHQSVSTYPSAAL